MGDRARPALYTIPAHRAFADALATGLIARHGADPMALARGMVLLPSNRAVRAVSDAFVRLSKGGLLLPRLVPIGDPQLDERLGHALDSIEAGADVPPAIDPVRRQMILARLVQQARAEARQPVDAGEAMRLGLALGSVLDQLHVERRAITDLTPDIEGDLSIHWQKSLDLFRLLTDRWPAELASRGLIDLADRRNRLFAAIARRWKDVPPTGFVVAAGISTTAPAIADLLARVAYLPAGQVVFAGLDQEMTEEEWDASGETHPQYALKLLLDRMSMTRDDVALWRWGSEHDARAVRGRNISNAMLPPMLTTKWRELDTPDRALSGIAAIEAATPAEEAQAIAIALREALETPERRAILVTPDRALAARVSAHLARWGIEADDSAGRPLAQLPPGTLLVAMAQAVAERFAPVALLALLKHPLVQRGDHRRAWLEGVRQLDLLLRGPRPPAGLAGIDQLLLPRPDDREASLRARVADWWPQARALLAPLESAFATTPDLPTQFAALREQAGILSADQVWAGHQGHAAADLFAQMEAAAPEGPREADVRALPAIMEDMLANAAVRPPQGGHPRIAILGLIEARLVQADLMILAGLNEGGWPSLPAPDPWLAPRLRRDLGLPGLDSRIGIAAHDFANALGAPDVLITRARRGADGPAVASRLWLRLKAMSGPQWKEAARYLDLARAIDRPDAHRPADRPGPSPPAAIRPRTIAVTEVDRLKADPYAFYARRMLRLSRLDPVDADPSAAWRGTAVHDILQHWAEEDDLDPAKLEDRARAMFRRGDAHPLLRAFWQPRLLEAIRWIAAQVAEDKAEGRRILLVETEGKAEICGVTLTGKADRIDRLPGGGLAIVDYKTGKPPSAKQVKAGFSLQLGLLGLIAETPGGFTGLDTQEIARDFEYWSLSRKGEGFGYRVRPVDPVGKGGKLLSADFTAHVLDQFDDAAGKWLTGAEPFTARLHPEILSYGDHDQLMRLEEWYGRGDD